MKHRFTKFSFLIALIFISLNVFSAGTTTRVITVDETFDCSNANITSSSTTWVTYTSGNYSARTNTCDNGSYPNLSSSSRTVVFYVSGVESFTITAEGNSVNTRTLFYKIGAGSNTATAVFGAGCSSQTFSTGNTGATTISISGNNGSIYLGNIKFSPPAVPTITGFTATSVSATIDQSAKTITAELPFGTNLTSIEPIVTIGGTATSYGPPGAQDFSNSVSVPVVYTVSDGANEVNYSVTLTAATVASSDKDLSNVTIGGLIPAFDAGTNTYSVTLPKSSSLTQAVSFTKPATATADFTSGNTHDFTNPLSITVTAQDLSTKTYTLNATIGTKNIAYVTLATGNDDPYLYGSLLEKGYYVEKVIAATQSTDFFDDFDLSILFDIVGSSSTCALNMGSLIGEKRFLNFKAFMYGKVGWPTGTGVNYTNPDAIQSVTVEGNYTSHPLFSGLTMSGFDVNLVGAGGTQRALQGVTSPGSGSVVAKIKDKDDAGIIEVNTDPTAMYLSIGLANGGTTYGLANISADGKKLLDNAVEYLLGDVKFSPFWTGISKPLNNSVTFDGQIIRNADRQQLNVFDVTGRLVASSVKDINMTTQAKGVYVVKGENGILKIALTK